MTDVERIVAQLTVVLLLGLVLFGVADTPLYPLAIGIEIVALFYVLVTGNTAQRLATDLSAYVKAVH